jgi:hypothetical protein
MTIADLKIKELRIWDFILRKMTAQRARTNDSMTPKANDAELNERDA